MSIIKSTVIIVMLLVANILMANTSNELYSAINSGDIEHVRKLINEGVDIDALIEDYSVLPLGAALFREDTEILKLLIESGADVNNAYANVTPPLLAAIFTGSLEKVKILIESGANPNLKFGMDQQNFPLSYAIFSKKFEIAIYLVSSGADTSYVNNYGKTIYQYAIDVGAPPEVLNLLKE